MKLEIMQVKKTNVPVKFLPEVDKRLWENHFVWMGFDGGYPEVPRAYVDIYQNESIERENGKFSIFDTVEKLDNKKCGACLWDDAVLTNNWLLWNVQNAIPDFEMHELTQPLLEKLSGACLSMLAPHVPKNRKGFSEGLVKNDFMREITAEF